MCLTFRSLLSYPDIGRHISESMEDKKLPENFRRKFSDEERLEYLRLYYSLGISKGSFFRNYGICPTLIREWTKRYSDNPELLSLQKQQEDMAKLSTNEYQEKISELQNRVKNLEKALAFSKLETKARDMMIDCAEDLFKISIRKKPGAK